MKRIILFRFHDWFEQCANRVALLRAFNPDLHICGLYGGATENRDVAESLGFDSFFAVPIDDPHWKWLHGDLCVRWWYREQGHRLGFDFAHIVEWDMVLLAPIAQLFAHVTDGIAISVIRRPSDFEPDTLIWTAPKRGQWELNRLREHVKRLHGLEFAVYLCVFAGASLSRAFLERFSQDPVPSYCNDEVRIPAYAQAYEMKIHRARSLENPYFRVHGTIDRKELEEGFSAGVRAFHKVDTDFSLPEGVTLPGANLGK